MQRAHPRLVGRAGIDPQRQQVLHAAKPARSHGVWQRLLGHERRAPLHPRAAHTPSSLRQPELAPSARVRDEGRCSQPIGAPRRRVGAGAEELADRGTRGSGGGTRSGEVERPGVQLVLRRLLDVSTGAQERLHEDRPTRGRGVVQRGEPLVVHSVRRGPHREERPCADALALLRRLDKLGRHERGRRAHGAHELHPRRDRQAADPCTSGSAVCSSPRGAAGPAPLLPSLGARGALSKQAQAGVHKPTRRRCTRRGLLQALLGTPQLQAAPARRGLNSAPARLLPRLMAAVSSLHSRCMRLQLRLHAHRRGRRPAPGRLSPRAVCSPCSGQVYLLARLWQQLLLLVHRGGGIERLARLLRLLPAVEHRAHALDGPTALAQPRKANQQARRAGVGGFGAVGAGGLVAHRLQHHLARRAAHSYVAHPLERDGRW
mmetsp:Transcript_22944/g.65638  ORF Transcript_22944/g.65638 Transcript_22944/m.65638 type:complete len:432 (-) Transcript_22944:1019-2314(-)